MVVDKMKILVIVNSVRLSKKKFEKIILPALKKNLAHHEITVEFTHSKGHSRSLANHAANEGFELILGIGGDGTFHEIVNGYLQDRQDHVTDDKKEILTTLGLIPWGTGNDLARTYNFKKHTKSIISRIESFKTKKVDVGQLNLSNGQQEYFINASTLGFGAAVISRMENYKNSTRNSFSYLKNILAEFTSYKPGFVKLTGDGVSWQGDAFMIGIAKGRYIGGGLGIAPDSNPDDGVLNIIIIGNVSKWDFIRNIPRLRKCKKISHPEIHYFKSPLVNLEFKNTDFNVEADGELVDGKVSKISCLKRKINLLL